MGIQSDYTLGMAKESVYGTGVVPSRFFEPETFSLKESVTTAQGSGMRPGKRLARAARRALVKRECAGDITMDATTVGLGYFLAAFFGVTTTTETAAASGVFQQVHTMKTSDFSDSYTIQQGIPRLGSGITDAYTYLGAQCSTLSIEAPADDIVSLSTSWVARELKLDTAYAAPSYPADLDLFTFVGGRIYVGGGAFTAPTATALATAGTALATVRTAQVNLDNGLDSNGFNMGGAGRRTRAAAYTGGKADAVGGSFELEYTNRDLVDAYLAQTELCMLLTFEGPDVIASGLKPTLQIAVPSIYLDGDLPEPNGGDVITTSHDWTGLQGTDPQPVYAVYRAADTAP